MNKKDAENYGSIKRRVTFGSTVKDDESGRFKRYRRRWKEG